MHRFALRPILFALVLVVAWVGVTPAMAQAVARSLGDAVAAFEAGDYRRAATLARMAGDRAAGVERESARYLEGTALLKAGDLAAAANALRAAVASTDRFIAGQANISLASVEVERRNWDSAGHAYRRAAAFLQGAQAVRAHSFAARCFDEAGMGGLAAAEREAAGEPGALASKPAQEAPRSTPGVAAPDAPAKDAPAKGSSAKGSNAKDPNVKDPNTKDPNAKDPNAKDPRAKDLDAKDLDVKDPGAKNASPRPTKPGPVVRDSRARVTEDDRPARNDIAKVRFAIQVGAFSTAARAAAAAAELRPKCKELGIALPRVVSRDSGDGKVLHIVQMGDFPNRGAAGRIQLRLSPNAYKIEAYLTEVDQPE